MGHYRVVEMLLAAGANKETATKAGCWTPLIIACRSGHLQVVGILLAAGANLETQDEFGLNPLWNACLRPHNVPLIRMLLDVGANIYRHNQKGEALLLDPTVSQKYRDILYEHHRDISLFRLLWTWYQRNEQVERDSFR